MKFLNLNANKVTDLYLLFLFALFPLTGGAYADITLWKTGIFLAVSAVWLLLLLLGGGCSVLPFSRSEKCLLVMGAAAFLAAVCSPFGGEAWLGMGRSGGFLGLLAFFCVRFFAARTGGGLKQSYADALAASTLLLSLIGILQLMGMNVLGLYPEGLTYYDGDTVYHGTFLTTIGNTGQLGAFYCLALPVIALSLRRDCRMWLYGAALFAALAVIVGAELSACMVGLALGFSAVFLFSRTKKQRPAALLAVILLLALVFLAAVGVDDLSRLLQGDFADDMGSMRMGIWKNTLLLIGERPLLGWGPDCFRGAYASLFPDGAVIDAAHNEYLGYWCELGIFGLLGYVGASLVSAVSLAKQKQWPALAMLICYGGQALFSFPTFIAAPLFWALWGLADGQLRNPASDSL